MQSAVKKENDSDKKDAAFKNAKEMPKAYYCRHMASGVVGYENETILVDTDTMKRMAASFVGKPVYVYHQDVNLDTLQEEMDGVVSDCFYNELDGWLWSKFIVVSDEGQDKIKEGWSVSNAYIPLGWGDGGTQHNVPYNRKVLDAEFTHLAIVPNPRYEKADIYTPEEYRQYQEERRNELKQIQNSKPTGAKIMLKLFKTDRKEVTANEADENTLVEITNAKGEKQEVSIKDMAAAVIKNAEDEAKKKEEEKTNMEDEVQVGDEKMPLKELVNRYNAMMKKNSDDADKEKKNAEEKAAEEKKAEEEKKENEKIAEEEKKNASKLEELKNAADKGAAATVVVQTIQNKVALGKSRYSLKN